MLADVRSGIAAFLYGNQTRGDRFRCSVGVPPNGAKQKQREID
jgi:hypothetical protein